MALRHKYVWVANFGFFLLLVGKFLYFIQIQTMYIYTVYLYSVWLYLLASFRKPTTEWWWTKDRLLCADCWSGCSADAHVPALSRHTEDSCTEWRAWLKTSAGRTDSTVWLTLANHHFIYYSFKRALDGALTLLVGRQEEHPACKNWVMRCWCGYLSGARSRLFAYGPADATASQNPIISCLI